jgi:hypothetical protein
MLTSVAVFKGQRRFSADAHSFHSHLPLRNSVLPLPTFYNVGRAMVPEKVVPKNRPLRIDYVMLLIRPGATRPSPGSRWRRIGNDAFAIEGCDRCVPYYACLVSVSSAC